VCLDGEELALQPLPLYAVPADNVTMCAVAATPAGRIFLGGSDGKLYEVMYEGGRQLALPPLLQGAAAATGARHILRMLEAQRCVPVLVDVTFMSHTEVSPCHVPPERACMAPLHNL